MEAVYLLLSIASAAVRSTFLSLILAVRSLFTPTIPPPPSSSSSVLLYEGHVHHVRRKPVHHSFNYPVRYALIDLDRSPQPAHLPADRARGVASTAGRVLLLTIPASVGYEQNPLSVYYCYDEEDSLKMCIAEVTNTPWGERVMFSFSPGSDLVAKPLHVSPFMDMLGNWNIHANAPGEDLFLAITVQHPEHGNYFSATLSAKRICSTSDSLKLAMYFWLMPHKVAVWIYLQAVKLWWKNVSFLGHPKYTYPMYRDKALARDRELHCSGHSGKDSDGTRDRDDRKRWCVWRDAEWPWS
ncbi:uncharacterized protein M6B38_133550 [Iris pallida]|uniref:DUF1365 domain-containing protein n=1 Tax=Iris pallida TaxID=29817 RepID=A0AAX6FI52_IRIPA|nr:uncharacterized protein M6B38_133550 [Iris pallida]